MAGLTLREVFGRVNQNTDDLWTRAEVEDFVVAAGVGDGMMGQTKIDTAVTTVMSLCDDNGDDQVSFQEFQTNTKKFFAADGMGMSVFNAADISPKNGYVSYDELQPELEARFEAAGASWAGTKAEIGALLAIATLGKNERIRRDDMLSLAAEAAAQNQKAWYLRILIFSTGIGFVFG